MLFVAPGGICSVVEESKESLAFHHCQVEMAFEPLLCLYLCPRPVRACAWLRCAQTCHGIRLLRQKPGWDTGFGFPAQGGGLGTPSLQQHPVGSSPALHFQGVSSLTNPPRMKEQNLLLGSGFTPFSFFPPLTHS